MDDHRGVRPGAEVVREQMEKQCALEPNGRLRAPRVASATPTSENMLLRIVELETTVADLLQRLNALKVKLEG